MYKGKRIGNQIRTKDGKHKQARQSTNSTQLNKKNQTPGKTTQWSQTRRCQILNVTAKQGSKLLGGSQYKGQGFSTWEDPSDAIFLNTFHSVLQSRQILPSQSFGEEQCSGKNKFHVSSSPEGRDFTRSHRERRATKEERGKYTSSGLQIQCG